MERTKKKEVEAPVREIPEEAKMTKLPAKEIGKVEYPVEPKLAVRAKLRYLKVGGGSFAFLGKTYKRDDVFEAYPEQIPEAFKNVVKCLNTPEEQKQSIAEGKGVPSSKEFLYTISPSIVNGWYNVINTETKKQINEKQLSKADAERLCASLNF